MSIAVSAVIVPSRLMRCVLLCHGAANLGAALVLAGGAGGAFSHPRLGAAACLLAAAAALRSLLTPANPRRIDISGLGHCRLTVQQSIAPGDAPAVAMQLLPGSTLWPALLLLRLSGPAAGALALWPDAVAPGQFRRLAVALRDLAARGETYKIL